MMTSPRKKLLMPAGILGLVLVAAVGTFAWSRVGLFDLPSVPRDITLPAAGLDGLPAMKQLDDALYAADAPAIKLSPAADSVRLGLSLIQANQAEEGLKRMREGIAQDPTNLVLANAYRMAAFQLRRDILGKQQAGPTVTFPAWIEKEPLAFFEDLDKKHPSRETKLNLALAWVDLMLLFPALEIKAPSSVESVKILTQLIDGQRPGGNLPAGSEISRDIVRWDIPPRRRVLRSCPLRPRPQSSAPSVPPGLAGSRQDPARRRGAGHRPRDRRRPEIWRRLAEITGHVGDFAGRCLREDRQIQQCPFLVANRPEPLPGGIHPGGGPPPLRLEG